MNVPCARPFRRELHECDRDRCSSNNGVDNIREIREEVAYRPTEGKYKVYIIDEVHMLSTGAFNALLKTLEEPPSYVIFILATTEATRYRSQYCPDVSAMTFTGYPLIPLLPDFPSF